MFNRVESERYLVDLEKRFTVLTGWVEALSQEQGQWKAEGEANRKNLAILQEQMRELQAELLERKAARLRKLVFPS